MGPRPDLVTSDRQSRLLLAVLLAAGLAIFVWLVASLASSAFG